MFFVITSKSNIVLFENNAFQVVLYQPNAGKGVMLGDEPPSVPLRGADAIHSYESLPENHWKKYIYAARFVNLVKAKTPKITYYSQQAKCLLMENKPNPDFEVIFYQGKK